MNPTPSFGQAPYQIAARSLALADEDLLAECEVEVYVASGPGGQHRNKTESGVRLTHRPTGIRVGATERRSQPQNKQVALGRLRAKLAERARPPVVRKKTKVSKGAKRRRVEEKRRHAEKKQQRRGWD